MRTNTTIITIPNRKNPPTIVMPSVITESGLLRSTQPTVSSSNAAAAATRAPPASSERTRAFDTIQCERASTLRGMPPRKRSLGAGHRSASYRVHFDEPPRVGPWCSGRGSTFAQRSSQ